MLFTVGHSTHTAATFLALLSAHQIDAVADVRLVPQSRRHPHFAQHALEAFLDEAGIAYRHFRDLGGHRRPRPDSPNGAWQNESFRGYADHLATAAWRSAMDELLRWEEPSRRLALMCAESVWWRCHRQLIADALVARGREVWHITSTAPPVRHTLTPFARTEGQHVWYPALI
ncbi:MAG: DUF488 domain-containing protein [Acidimicrobiia bacterium]|nr:DUF488 domain-containing protein [Acidimicrobiia bacterium]